MIKLQILIVFLFTISIDICGQNIKWGKSSLNLKNIFLEIKNDSFDVFSVKLVNKSGTNLICYEELKFKDYFSNNNSIDFCGSIYLSKIVLNQDMIWAPNDINILFGQIYDSTGTMLSTKRTLKKLKNGDIFKTALKLREIYPLDNGNYCIMLRVKVMYKSKWFFVYSEPYIFDFSTPAFVSSRTQ